MSTILIVDDDANLRMLLANLFNGEHTVIEASNGKDGLHMFTRHRPDLIIADISMPYLNGVELVENIRGGHRDVKIVIYSAFVNETDKSLVCKAGADLCLQKPTDLIALKAAINDLLS